MKLIVPSAPFDFQEMLRRPLSRPSKVAHISLANVSYTTTVELQGRVVPFTVQNAGKVDMPVLHLHMPDDVSEDEAFQIERMARHAFSTEIDLGAFYGHMGQWEAWPHVLYQFHGLRPIQDVNLFASIIKVVIGQQLNVKFAATLVERLIDLGDSTIEWEGNRLAVFPSPETVASWSYEDLRRLSFSQRKAEYVIDVARTIVGGRIELDGLWELSDSETYEVLLPLRGVGRWTVECFLLFGMGRQDIMPAADIGVQNALKQLYQLESRPREEEVRELTASWAPWRSLATYYLWQSLIRDDTK